MSPFKETLAREPRLRKSGRIWAKTLTEEDFPCSLDLRPFGRSNKRRRSRKKLNPDKVSNRLIRSRHTSYMADARVYRHLTTLQLQMERLH